MGIYDFKGETYVAFIDISGFKRMMKDKDRIAKVVYNFYDSGYTILKQYQTRGPNEPSTIQGIFVSDCGILFVNINHQSNEVDLRVKRESLNQLLNVVKKINLHMIDINVMLTTSIAYGSLTCTEKIEFKGISKNPFYGDAYLNAFVDHKDRQKKIHAGECRIVKKTLPEGLITEGSKSHFENFELLREKLKNKSHIYFYWMVKGKSEITKFNKDYANIETERYRRMTELIKKYVESSN